MPVVALSAQRSAALRITTVAESRFDSLRAVGTINGVVFLHVAARNGRGTGEIRSSGDGTMISWRAPGSKAFGQDVLIGSAETQVVLYDGEDADKWVEVIGYNNHLVVGPSAADVLLTDYYDNTLSDSDVTAAEATAGAVKTWQLKLKNDGRMTMRRLIVWMDPAMVEFEMGSKFGTGTIFYFRPMAPEFNFLFNPIPSGGTEDLWVRRTIPAGATSAPNRLVQLYFRWQH